MGSSKSYSRPSVARTAAAACLLFSFLAVSSSSLPAASSSSSSAVHHSDSDPSPLSEAPPSLNQIHNVAEKRDSRNMQKKSLPHGLLRSPDDHVVTTRQDQTIPHVSPSSSVALQHPRHQQYQQLQPQHCNRNGQQLTGQQLTPPNNNQTQRKTTWIEPLYQCSPQNGCPLSTHQCLANPNHHQKTTNDICSACQKGQTYWPCDVDGLCYCWDTTQPQIPPAPSTRLANDGKGLQVSAIDPCDLLTEEVFDALAPEHAFPYSYPGFCKAVSDYNANHPGEGVFNMGTERQQRHELAAFLGNALHESDEFKAGREYLMCADRVELGGEAYCKPCSADGFDWDTFTCPWSLASENRPFNSYCQSNLLPPDGCECDDVFERSSTGELAGFVKANQVYFGRGAIQLSWNYNYIRASVALTGAPQTFCQRPDLIATKEEYAWGAGLFYWMENVKNDKTCHQSILINADFGETLDNINGGLECPADDHGWHGQAIILRLNRYCRAASALGVESLMSLDGCMDMSTRMEHCLEEGTCKDCEVWAGKIGNDGAALGVDAGGDSGVDEKEEEEEEKKGEAVETEPETKTDATAAVKATPPPTPAPKTPNPTTSPSPDPYEIKGPCAGDPCPIPPGMENNQFCRSADGICGSGPAYCNALSSWTPFCHDCSTDSAYGCPTFGCNECYGETQQCVGNLNGINPISDADCNACGKGQTYWPCDIEGSAGCWCWDMTLPRVEPSPPSGMELDTPKAATKKAGEGVCGELLDESTLKSLAPNAIAPFTYQGLCDAIDQYNSRHAEKIFRMGTYEQRLAELAAFLGIASHETNGFMAPREYLACGDNKKVKSQLYCKPCSATQYNYDTHSCSTSMLENDQTYYEFCQPFTTPPDGCKCDNVKEVEASGELEGHMKANDIFFGRGSIQLSHNFNYIRASATMTGSDETFCQQPELLATVDSYSWGVGLYIWMEYMSKDGMTSHINALNGDYGSALNIINGGSECPVKEDDVWYAKAVVNRVDHYCHAAKVIGVTNLMGLGGCEGLEGVFNSCMSDGSCPNCAYWDPNNIHTSAPTDPPTTAPPTTAMPVESVTTTSTTTAAALSTSVTAATSAETETTSSSTVSSTTLPATTTTTTQAAATRPQRPTERRTKRPTTSPTKFPTSAPTKPPTSSPTDTPIQDIAAYAAPSTSSASNFAVLKPAGPPASSPSQADTFALSHSKARGPPTATGFADSGLVSRSKPETHSPVSSSPTKSPTLPSMENLDVMTDWGLVKLEYPPTNSPAMDPAPEDGKKPAEPVNIAEVFRPPAKDDTEKPADVGNNPDEVMDISGAFRPPATDDPKVYNEVVDAPEVNRPASNVDAKDGTATSPESMEEKSTEVGIADAPLSSPDAYVTKLSDDSYIFKPLGDTTISRSRPDENFGSDSSIVVSKMDGDVGLFLFDLSSISDDAIIDKAVLRLTIPNVDGITAGIYYVQPTLTGWSEDSVTYSTAPKSDGSLFASVVKPDDENHIELDVSKIISNRVVSFRVIGTDQVLSEFSSKDSNEENSPMILVKLALSKAEPNLEELPSKMGAGTKDKPTVVKLSGSDEGEISGNVWLDKNNDGVQDVGEPGLRGILVDLYHCASDEWIEGTRTSGAGDYIFDKLADGKYYVVVTSEVDYAFIARKRNSNVDPVTGRGECVELSSPGNLSATVNAGIIKLDGSSPNIISTSQSAVANPITSPATVESTNNPTMTVVYNCRGKPCADGDGTWCRSRYNFCGAGEQYCNEDSQWKPDCGTSPPSNEPTISPTTVQPTVVYDLEVNCSGEPCGNAAWCRSQLGFCGNGVLYCNSDSLWVPECDATVTASTPTAAPNQSQSETPTSLAEQSLVESGVPSAMPAISSSQDGMVFSNFALPTLSQVTVPIKSDPTGVVKKHSSSTATDSYASAQSDIASPSTDSSPPEVKSETEGSEVSFSQTKEENSNSPWYERYSNLEPIPRSDGFHSIPGTWYFVSTVVVVIGLC